MKKLELGVCVAVLSFATGTASAVVSADETVGFRETLEIPAAKDATVERSQSLLATTDERVFKTGEGTVKMPWQAIDTTAPFPISVNAGTLELTSDSFSQDATPPACLDDAQLWLDCSHAATAVVTNGVDESGNPTTPAYVPVWYDRRETDIANPTRFYAKAAWTNHAESPLWGVPPCLQTVEGRKAIWFGGRLSSQCMWFYMNGEKVFLDGMRDIFVVHAVSNSVGILIGNKGDSSAPFFNTQNSTWDSAAGYYNVLRSSCGSGCFYSRGYLDGVRIDPYTTKPKKGFQCFNKHYLDDGNANYAQGYAIFHGYPSAANGEGGDWISEIIVFKRQISELERLQVERYLMRKWNLPNRTRQDLVETKPVRINAADGATVSLDVAEGQRTEGVELAGNGAFVKKGAGEMRIGPSDPKRPMTGMTTLEGGSFFLQGGKPPSLPVSAGARIVSREVKLPTVAAALSDEEQAASGTRITVGDDAGADTVVKEGEGPAHVRSIASGVRHLKVLQGRLTLDVGYKPVASDVTPVSVAVPNADFEISGPPLNTGTAYENFAYFATSLSGFGWSTASGTSVMLLMEDFKSADGSVNLASRSTWLPPEIQQGTNVLYMISGPASASTKVTFPRSGRYQFGFLGSARNRSNQGTPVVSFSLDGQVFGTCKLYYAAFTRYYYRTFAVEAGREYAFTVSTRNNSDTGAALDAFRFDYLDESDRTPTAYQIPNGDFEDVVETNDPNHKDDRIGRFDPDVPYLTNGTKGWTLMQDVIASGRSYAFLSHVAKRNYFSDGQDVVWGAIQLGLCAKDTTCGWAETTFAPPAGTYRLRGRLASWPCNHIEQFQNNPSVKAQLTVVSADQTKTNAVELGSLALGLHHVLSDYVWPTAFTVAEGDSVTLRLTDTASRSCALVDDLDLVSDAAYGAEDDGELLKDGACESTSVWVGMTPKPPSHSSVELRQIREYGGVVSSGDQRQRSVIWGANRASGKNYMCLGTCGSIQQTVTLPSAGTYRLSFLERSRLDVNCGGNRVTVWCRTEDGTVTNSIIRSPRYFATNFVENVGYFSVDKPGRYVLGVQGLGYDTSKEREDVESIYENFSLRQVTRELADVPSVPEDLHIIVAQGAILHLDFPGTLRTGAVRLGGRGYTGIINAKTHPEFVCGMGTIEAVGTGGMIIVR